MASSKHVHFGAASFAARSALSFRYFPDHPLISLRQYHHSSHKKPTMACRRKERNIAPAPAALPKQMANNVEDTSWTDKLPLVEQFAPGGTVSETLEDFVLDQSEGEDSSNENSGEGEEGVDDDAGQGRAGIERGSDVVAEDVSSAEEGETNERAGNQAPRFPAATLPKKLTRVRWTTEYELVLYLLHHHVSLATNLLVDVFNHIFSGKSGVRAKNAIVKRWSRFKENIQKKFANPTAQVGLAEHKA